MWPQAVRRNATVWEAIEQEHQGQSVTHLLSLDCGLAAVASVVAAEGSVVDRVTVVVSHERLEEGRVVLRQQSQPDGGETIICKKNTEDTTKHRPALQPP